MGFQENKREIRQFVMVFVRTGASGLSQSHNTPQRRDSRDAAHAASLLGTDLPQRRNSWRPSFLRSFAFSETGKALRQPLFVSVESSMSLA